MKYKDEFKKYLRVIESEIERVLPKGGIYSFKINEAMKYTLFSGGKRFRSILALGACKACGGKLKDAIPASLAVELIHTYSLVHDDLPSLDNDDMRRGRKSCHRRFGEATAILTGDALLTLAFELIAEINPSDRAVSVLKELSIASGTRGMIGGQIADLMMSDKKKNLKALDYISTYKTGCLIRGSAVIGALSSGASSDDVGRMRSYGEFLGLAFQIVDDILDGDGYLRFMKKEEASLKAKKLIIKAKKTIQNYGKKADTLNKLADFILQRIP